MNKWISPIVHDPIYVRQPSRLACWLSHRKVWELIASSQDDLALVLEDDAVFVSGFYLRLDASMKQLLAAAPGSLLAHQYPFDIAVLGAYDVQRSVDGALVSFEGTQAYLLSRSGAATLLSLCGPSSISAALDWALPEWSSTGKLRLRLVSHLVRQHYLLSGSDVSSHRSAGSMSASARGYLGPNLLQQAESALSIARTVASQYAGVFPSFASRMDDLSLCLADLVQCVVLLSASAPASSANAILLAQRRARQFLELCQDYAFLFHLCIITCTAPFAAQLQASDMPRLVDSISDSLFAALKPQLPISSPGSLNLTALEGPAAEHRLRLVWDSDTVKDVFGDLVAAAGPWRFSSAVIDEAPREEHKYILLCFSSAGAWHAYHDAYNVLRSAQPQGRMWLTETELPAAMRDNRGVVALVEWRTGRLLAVRRLAMPQGLWIDKESLHVGRRLNNDVVSLTLRSRFALPVRMTHPKIANVHTIERCIYEPNRDVYLLSCADSDALFEVSAAGDIIWQWSAEEHGFVSPTPHPPDYRPYTCHSLAHAVHPNSASYLSRDRILVTLFHLHSLGCIDRVSGELTILTKSLSFPHAVRPVRDAPLSSIVAFSVANTRGGQILLLDRDAVEISRVPVKCNWIQDAIVSGYSAFVSCNMDVKKRDPTDHNRLLEIDIRSGNVLRSVVFGSSSHLYASYVLSEAEAAVWGRAWLAEDAREESIDSIKQRLLFVAEKLWRLDLRGMAALYLHGSRVRGLASPDSDWDFVAVLAGDAPLEQHYQSQACRIDLTVLSLHTFMNEIRAHHLWRLACCHSPPAFILSNAEPLASFKFTPSPVHLLHAAVHHSLLHYNKAVRAYALARPGAPALLAAKKKIFHALLLLAWAEDLARNGRVTDQESANHYWDELQQDSAVDWSVLHLRWRKVVLANLARIAALCGQSFESIPGQWCVHPPLVSQPSNGTARYADAAQTLALLQEVIAYGVASACEARSLPVSVHCEYAELLQCGAGGAIVQTGGKAQQLLVCAPLWKEDAGSSLLLYRMYRYDGQWKLACHLRPDFVSDRDLEMSSDHSPSLVFWDAWARSGLALPKDDRHSYCYTVGERKLKQVSVTNLQTVQRVSVHHD